MMKNLYSIVALPGDGVGQEVVDQGIRVLEKIAQATELNFEIELIQCGGHYYAVHETEWPEGSFAKCEAADAILLGAVGHVVDGKTVFTKPGKPYQQSQLAGFAQVIGNRQKLDLYANVRPIKLYEGVPQKISGTFQTAWKPDKVDYVVVRENTEDAYSGETFDIPGGKQTPINITEAATERVVRFACKLAKQRNKLGRITCVDKSNIIGAHAYFKDIFYRVVRDEFPELEADHAYFDAFCLLQLQQPEVYDVVVSPNLVGDVISDNGSFIQGGMGMAPAGNIGDEHAMFEPVHGSAPPLAGKDVANPIATILSVAMMLEWLAQRYDDERLLNSSNRVEVAVIEFLKQGELLPQDLGGQAKCSAIADAIVSEL
jgi:3-isopropylmalate dehydrogenase